MKKSFINGLSLLFVSSMLVLSGCINKPEPEPEEKYATITVTNGTGGGEYKVGDIIKFIKEPELNEYFECKVTDLLKFDSFMELFKNYDIDLLADKSMTKKELINVLEEFYTKEKQKQYGVLGIKVELIK